MILLLLHPIPGNIQYEVGLERVGVPSKTILSSAIPPPLPSTLPYLHPSRSSSVLRKLHVVMTRVKDKTVEKTECEVFFFYIQNTGKFSVKSKTLQLLCTVELSCSAAGRWHRNKKRRQTGYDKRAATIDNLRNVIPHVALYTALKH